MAFVPGHRVQPGPQPVRVAQRADLVGGDDERVLHRVRRVGRLGEQYLTVRKQIRCVAVIGCGQPSRVASNDRGHDVPVAHGLTVGLQGWPARQFGPITAVAAEFRPGSWVAGLMAAAGPTLSRPATGCRGPCYPSPYCAPARGAPARGTRAGPLPAGARLAGSRLAGSRLAGSRLAGSRRTVTAPAAPGSGCPGAAGAVSRYAAVLRRCHRGQAAMSRPGQRQRGAAGRGRGGRGHHDRRRHARATRRPHPGVPGQQQQHAGCRRDEHADRDPGSLRQ